VQMLEQRRHVGLLAGDAMHRLARISQTKAVFVG
jgi:hypothetical protein